VPLFSQDGDAPLSRGKFIAQVKSNLACAGFDASSFQDTASAEGASSAAAVGFNDYEIQQLGRWHSDSYKLYMDGSQARILSLSSCLHWVIPHGQHFEPPSLHLPSSLAEHDPLGHTKRVDATQYHGIVRQHIQTSIRWMDTPVYALYAGGYVIVCTQRIQAPAEPKVALNSQSHVDYMHLVDPLEKHSGFTAITAFHLFENLYIITHVRFSPLIFFSYLLER